MNDAFAEILKIFLEFLLTKIEEKNAGDAFLIILGIIIIAIVFGFIIGWLLSKKKLKAEIKKINAEQKAQAIENYEKMQDYRKKYLESSILVQMATSDITKNLNNNAINELKETILSYRDLIFNNMIEDFERYCDIFEINYQESRRKFVELVKDELFPMIQTINNILEIINMDTILKATGLNKFLMNESLYRGLSRLYMRNLPIYSWILKIKVTCSIKNAYKENKK